MSFLRKIPIVFMVLFIVGSITLGTALAVTFTDTVVADSTTTHAIMKAETSAGSAIFRMNDVGTKIYDIQVLDGLARMDFVDRSLNAPRLTVTSDGNIGIGTTIPTAKLEVFSPTSEIKIRSQAGPAILSLDAFGGDAKITLKDPGVGSYAIQMPDGTDTLEIKDINSNEVRMSIASNGDICLGTGC